MTPGDTRVPSALAASTGSVAKLWLPALLAIVAGMVDVAGYLSLGHVFTAHITGNLVVIAADIVSNVPINPVQVIALPVFMLAVAAIWLLAAGWGRQRPSLITVLLAIHFFLLTSVLLAAVTTGSSVSPRRLTSGLTAMIAVSAMACQFALLRLVMPIAPSTAVMTGNLANAVLALLDLVQRRPIAIAARHRLFRSVLLIAGFMIGCFISAATLPILGNWIWSLPATLAGAIAFAVAISGTFGDQQKSSMSLDN
jgi:uncharacterized membrane protein YoaK (UPF0700 family)